MSKKQLYAFLCLIFTLIGGGMVATKFALLSFSPVQIVFMRLLIPACVYAALHKKWLPLPYQRGDWKFFVIIVVCEPCLFFICETLGMMYTSASQGGVIAACLPILMGVAGWIFLKEKPNVQLMLGILLAVIGVAGASWFGSTSEAAPHPLLGNLFMFCSILASSLYAVFTRRLTQRYPVLAIAAIQSIGGALFFLPLNFFSLFLSPYTLLPSSAYCISASWWGWWPTADSTTLCSNLPPEKSACSPAWFPLPPACLPLSCSERDSPCCRIFS